MLLEKRLVVRLVIGGIKVVLKNCLSRKRGATIVLPLASIIETGNHIAQAGARRFESATSFCTKLKAVADAEIPWAAFSEQADLWTPESLRRIADEWPALAATGLSMGGCHDQASGRVLRQVGHDGRDHNRRCGAQSI